MSERKFLRIKHLFTQPVFGATGIQAAGVTGPWCLLSLHEVLENGAGVFQLIHLPITGVIFLF